MKLMFYIAVLLLFLAPTQKSSSFQLFTSDKWIDPSYREFTFYISSTTYDFDENGQVDTNELHVELIAKSLQILTDKSGIPGLAFSYGGTYDADAAMASFYNNQIDEAFDKKIYIDFTSKFLWGRNGQVSGLGDGRKSPTSGDKRSGGLIHINTDYVNWTHPAVNLSSTIIHEVLHIFGLDHSSGSSSIMAYTEFWYPTISDDDILGLKQVFLPEEGSKLVISTKLAEEPAPGVEIVFINKLDGRTYTVLSNKDSTGTIRHLPDGTYLLSSRELSPTGPCFKDPTRGFMTSFYQDETNATNDPTEATELVIDENTDLSLTLNLIKQQKNFDCHFLSWSRIALSQCGEYKDGPVTAYTSCYQHMTVAGIRYPAYVWNDLSMFHHKTDTNLESGYHQDVSFVPVGTNPQLTFHSSEISEYANKSYEIDFEVATGAPPGVYAAYCQAQGETALMSSFIEVQDFGGSLNNYLLAPNLLGLMKPAEAPRNFGQFPRPGVRPIPGEFPGAGDPGDNEAPEGAPNPDPEKEDRKICGVVVGKKDSLPVALGFLIPIFIPMLALRRRKYKIK